jgi:hypothetical protein
MNPNHIDRASILAAMTCTASGVIYAVVSGPIAPNPGPPRVFVLAASIIGAVSLVVAGKWQGLTPPGARGLSLATLTALAGVYALANVVGATLTELGAWRTPFFVGAAVGAGLFAAAARALLADQRATQSIN